MFSVLGKNCFHSAVATDNISRLIGRRIPFVLTNWTKVSTFQSYLCFDHNRNESDKHLRWRSNRFSNGKVSRFLPSTQSDFRISLVKQLQQPQRWFASMEKEDKAAPILGGDLGKEDRDPFTYNMPKVPQSAKPKTAKEVEEKLTVFQKFKKMFREYWYVLVPVHLLTSAFWFGTFYYMAISGVDIVPLLRKVGASDGIISKIENSGAGHVAIAYAMYKLATPIRYTVTVGGTTVAVTFLTRWGIIRPAPSPAKFHQFLRVKGALFFRRRKIRSKGRANIQPPLPPPPAGLSVKKPKMRWKTLQSKFRFRARKRPPPPDDKL